MSRDNIEVLDVMKHVSSPSLSTIVVNPNQSSPDAKPDTSHSDMATKETDEDCICPKKDEIKEEIKGIAPEEVEKLVAEKEKELRQQFEAQMEKEISFLKDRFDFILQNEQVRASYMLREAHRERQEKVSALQTQLQCKNLAGLMYVMCTERRKSKLEKLRIIEDFTEYIDLLQEILTEGQALILHLSRGYKTAARVDFEWKQKMKKVLKEFQNFVYNFAGGSPESNQYFFDIPDIMQIKAPLIDNPEEDPCDYSEDEMVMQLPEDFEEKSWWERLDDDCRPFVMFGDMSDFKSPDRRREIIKKIVHPSKTAPKKWKEYVFNEMKLKSGCPNINDIKDVFHLPESKPWECHAAAAQTQSRESKSIGVEQATSAFRQPVQSIDMRGNMGSILKIIYEVGAFFNSPNWYRPYHGTYFNICEESSAANRPSTKSNLLGARDSMEIASTTKLKEKHRHSDTHSKVVINVRNRRTSFFDEANAEDFSDSEDDYQGKMFDDSARNVQSKIEEDESMTINPLGGHHTDSLEIVNQHVPEPDHKINYEKVCPVERCQRMHVDSFSRALPSYMQTNPFAHFEQSFDLYETCTPEQLEIVKERIEHKRKKERGELDQPPLDPLAEWTPSIQGIAVQTSNLSMLSLPPCTCRDPPTSPASSTGRIYKLLDLIPMKQNLDEIKKNCLFDSQVEFDRFKVIGQDDSLDVIKPTLAFGKARLFEIRKILKQHPSLCDLFQANSQP